MQSRNSLCHCGSGKKFKTCHGAKVKLVPEPGKQRLAGPALIVCLPNRGSVTIETVTSLSNLDGIPAVMRTVSRKPVSEARNTLAAMALEVPSQVSFIPTAWYCLWVDSDAWWRKGTVLSAVQNIHQNRETINLLAGWFCARSPMASPAVRNRMNQWPRPGTDCEPGDIVEIARCGFHFVIHPLELLDELGKDPFTLADGDEAEDYAFCRKVREANKRLWVHTGLPVAHIDDDGLAYIPGEPAHRVVDGNLLKMEQPKARSYGSDIDAKIQVRA